MANKLDPMDLKQILTLQKEGLSSRRTVLTLGVLRNTVNSYAAEFWRKCAMERGSMKLEHEPGYVMFVAFAGKKLEFKDRHTGLDIQDLNRLVFLPDNNEKNY